MCTSRSTVDLMLCEGGWGSVNMRWDLFGLPDEGRERKLLRSASTVPFIKLMGALAGEASCLIR